MLPQETLALLRKLIATPSFSKEEDRTAQIIVEYFDKKGIETTRLGNNVIVRNKHFDQAKPNLLLNSHHDTVKPVKGWTRDPFKPTIDDDGKLYGLGSNDAGASLVALAAAFTHFYGRQDLKYNLIFAATAEEEISGQQGIASVLPQLPTFALGIVGEPTMMQMAIAEKGLMVIDATAHGKAGHAARNEGVNAIYVALQDIETIRTLDLGKPSHLLGDTKLTVTQIEAGSQHNVIPDSCRFVIDARTNEHFSNVELFELLKTKLQSELRARSFRLNSSHIDDQHPFVKLGRSLGLASFGSPTLSDQALMSFPTVKIGCGDSARSHTANEFIYIHELEQGINVYVKLLESFML